MNDKERAAMQQAIEFIVDCEYGKAELALREALEHSGKANEFEPDWDGTLGLVEEIKRLAIENERLRHGEIKYEDWEFNPMTGESLLVENHGQEPVAVVEITYGREPECYVTGNIDDFPEGVFKLYAAPVQQAEQEPVAWALTSENGEVLDCISHTYKVTQPCTVDYDEPLYAAHVRTKDLTDDEIFKTNKTELPDCQDLVDFARAVIAADREKNRRQ